MPAKLVTYNSQNYAGTLDSGLLLSSAQKSKSLSSTLYANKYCSYAIANSYDYNIFNDYINACV